MSQVPSRRRFDRLARGRAVVLALAVGGAMLVAPAGALAKTSRGILSDPTGDAVAAGVDITQVQVRYKTNGSILAILTTAGPIDAVANDATFAFAVFSKNCSKPLLGGGGMLSAPGLVFAFTQKPASKLGKPRAGSGEITNNVYTVKVKHSSFRDRKPGCFAAALLGENDTVLDETEPAKFAR